MRSTPELLDTLAHLPKSTSNKSFGGSVGGPFMKDKAFFFELPKAIDSTPASTSSRV